jgi:uncharacterized protein YcgI (DUF1989 family)
MAVDGALFCSMKSTKVGGSIMAMSLEEARKQVSDHDQEFAYRKPSVPGKVVEYVFLPAMGFMMGRLVKKGQVIRIIDLEGQQVADTIIWDAGNLYLPFTNVSFCNI